MITVSTMLTKSTNNVACQLQSLTILTYVQDYYIGSWYSNLLSKILDMQALHRQTRAASFWDQSDHTARELILMQAGNQDSQKTKS